MIRFQRNGSCSSRKAPLAFISYRRADSDALAGRIGDRMRAELKGWDIFVDVESIVPGANFRQVIDAALARCTVLVPLIGTRWLGEGGARIHDPDDLVRYEIKSALAAGIRIIPVLINDARMPEARSLPADIAALADRNAIEVRHSRFDDDFANLAKTITGRAHTRAGGKSVLVILGGIACGALAGVAVAIGALVIHFHATGMSASERIGEDGATLLLPVCAAIGAAVWSWTVSRR
jgi:hypothetical protein